MAQGEVIKVLQKHNKPLLTKDIAFELGIAVPNISKNIKKLIKQNIISYKKVKLPHNSRFVRVYKLKEK